MPSRSSERFMASKLLDIGVLRPFSKSLTVDNDTLENVASWSCDQSSHPLAALHCSGVIPYG